jgi:hypothetical protein
VSELRARPYTPADRAAWDRHVRESRIPHPMFERGWVEYHADRFVDASLIVEDPAKPGAIVAAIPASAHGDEIVSHGGLSFGGLLTTHKVGATKMLAVLEAVRTAYAEQGFTNLRYKAVPHVFHAEPAEEDLYALIRAGANLARRDMSAAIDLTLPMRYGKGRKWSIKHASDDVELRYGHEYDAFIALETEVLKKHNVTPPHTGTELALLNELFPDDVRLLGAWSPSGDLLGGTLTITTPSVVHTQYIGASPAGRELGVVDRLIDHVIREHAIAGRRWLSFGISTERNGSYLNAGLAAHKESFGARGLVYDHYDLPLARSGA